MLSFSPSTRPAIAPPNIESPSGEARLRASRAHDAGFRTRAMDGGRPDAQSAAATVWGLAPQQLHDAHWSGRGVQCVRLGGDGATPEVDRTADLYLLLEPDQCVIFDLASMIERIVWHGAKVTRIRILQPAPTSYEERIICDERGMVQRIERRYGSKAGEAGRSRRTFITDRPALAERWRRAATAREGWRSIRRALGARSVRSGRIDRVRVPGQSFTLRTRDDEASLLDTLVDAWPDPGNVIDGIDEIAPGVWKLSRDGAAPSSGASRNAGLVGPVWLGCGRVPREPACIVGPAWVADDPEALQAARAVEGRKSATIRTIPDVEFADAPPETARRVRPLGRRPDGLYPMTKRGLDIAISAASLVIAAPLMLLIAVAIFASDGRPIFFRHKRQTRGGRVFNCLKFRTMHHNADRMITADAIKALNVCDGAQVYIPDDPRVTRIGRILRKTHLDELPQLWNVLVGEMSLVGPRPSPDSENRYCPAWRELRLSVRPGMTGLWQLKRTRSPGRDFQEWIRYDIEYVRNAGFALDLRILLETARLFVLGRSASPDQPPTTNDTAGEDT